MKVGVYRFFENPPTTNKEKRIGDIWMAKVKFGKGNFYKPRPVLIIDYVKDKYLCSYITSKPRGKEIHFKGNGFTKKYDKSYLTTKKMLLSEYDFYELLERGWKNESN